MKLSFINKVVILILLKIRERVIILILSFLIFVFCLFFDVIKSLKMVYQSIET